MCWTCVRADEAISDDDFFKNSGWEACGSYNEKGPDAFDLCYDPELDLDQ